MIKDYGIHTTKFRSTKFLPTISTFFKTSAEFSLVTQRVRGPCKNLLTTATVTVLAAATVSAVEVASTIAADAPPTVAANAQTVGAPTYITKVFAPSVSLIWDTGRWSVFNCIVVAAAASISPKGSTRGST